MCMSILKTSMICKSELQNSDKNYYQLKNYTCVKNKTCGGFCFTGYINILPYWKLVANCLNPISFPSAKKKYF